MQNINFAKNSERKLFGVFLAFDFPCDLHAAKIFPCFRAENYEHLEGEQRKTVLVCSQLHFTPQKIGGFCLSQFFHLRQTRFPLDPC